MAAWVIVADDDPANRKIAARILGNAGFYMFMP